MKKITTSLLLIAALMSGAQAQDFKFPAPSPSTTIIQDFGTSSFTIKYSRPSMKGRTIMNDMLPYGNVWRTGANAATTITFEEEIRTDVGVLPAGTYAIYTIPNKESWTIIFNRGVKNWGSYEYNEKDDVIRIDVPTKTLSESVETFTIDIENMTINSCIISMSWENTKISFPIKMEVDSKIEAYFERALKSDNPPYLQAAKYYADKGTNLEAALTYIDKTIKSNPKAFYMYSIKADILNKLGRRKEALKEAKYAADASKGTPYEAEQQKNYENILRIKY